MMCEDYPCCGHEDYECAEYNEDDWDDDEDELSPDASDFIAEEDACKICAPFDCATRSATAAQISTDATACASIKY
jgi:hypothetical protein